MSRFPSPLATEVRQRLGDLPPFDLLYNYCIRRGNHRNSYLWETWSPHAPLLSLKHTGDWAQGAAITIG